MRRNTTKARRRAENSATRGEGKGEGFGSDRAFFPRAEGDGRQDVAVTLKRRNTETIKSMKHRGGDSARGIRITDARSRSDASEAARLSVEDGCRATESLTVYFVFADTR